jgi:hypothetical protein
MRRVMIIASALAVLCLCGCAGVYAGGDVGGGNARTDTHNDFAPAGQEPS